MAPPRPYAEPVGDPLSVGQGWQESVTPTVPAGNSFIHRPGSQYIARVLSVDFVYTASGTAGTRFPQVRLLDGRGNVMTRTMTIAGIGASTAGTVSAFPLGTGIAPAGSGTHIIPLAGPLIEPGGGVQIFGVNGAANDQISALTIAYFYLYSDVRRPARQPRRGRARRQPLP